LARQTYLICAPQLLIVEGLPGRCPAGYAGAGGGQGSVWWHLAGPARPRWRSQRRGGGLPAPASLRAGGVVARRWWRPAIAWHRCCRDPGPLSARGTAAEHQPGQRGASGAL